MKKLFIPLAFFSWIFISCGSGNQTDQANEAAIEMAEELDSLSDEINESIQDIKDQTEDVKAAVDGLLEEE